MHIVSTFRYISVYFYLLGCLDEDTAVGLSYFTFIHRQDAFPDTAPDKIYKLGSCIHDDRINECPKKQK